MGKITEELLRKRAEHNEGVLSTLEEIALHQFEIEKIENLERYCRHLKILQLQNNIIEKLENLEKLKELEYLNLAVNSIGVIEGLDQCESLNKLDLTLNFIELKDLKQSALHLAKIPSLRELYMTGNPCEDWKKCREYIVHLNPQITFYNGDEVKKSEKIKAAQNFPFLEKELEEEIVRVAKAKENDPDKDNPNAYTKEYRRKLYLDLEEDRNKREAEKTQKRYDFYDEGPTGPPEVYKADGTIRICNQGKYDFLLDEDYFRTGVTTFTLKLPKYLDTSQIKVDLNPTYIRCDIKGKITQLKFDYEIQLEGSTIQRSQTTGYLVVKADIVSFKKRDSGTGFGSTSNFGSHSTAASASRLGKKEDPIPLIKAPEKKKDKELKPFITYKDDKINGITEVKKTVDPDEEMKKKAEIETKLKDIDLSDLPDLD